MKIVFESVLLFSLAVLVIAVGLLVYYFKTRISDLENKNTKCLEIVNDIYSQHNQLKVNVEYLANRSSQTEPAMTYYRENGDNIQFHVAEDDDHYEDDEDDVKIVNVDLSGPVDSDINITDEIEDPDLYENVDVDELESAKKPTIVKIDVHDSDLESDNESRLEVDNDSRSEVDNDSRTEVDNESRSEAFRELFNPATKDNYKKMDVRSLRQLVITRGLATDNTARMKKNELIDILLTIV
jgi:hypothetical protein